jgi:hypothetical protein
MNPENLRFSIKAINQLLIGTFEATVPGFGLGGKSVKRENAN